jgi:hypothetical protein
VSNLGQAALIKPEELTGQVFVVLSIPNPVDIKESDILVNHHSKV